jgi:ketosteroid isomerase-like protein
MKTILFALALFISSASFAQSSDETAIRKVLSTQNDAWNRGDVDAFMIGYWKSDSLMFIGQSGVTYGWQNTLNNYKKNYPDTAIMGKLTFTLISVKKLSDKYYRVVGKWFLKRSVGDVGGHFTLLFQKINGEWVIIEDHSS